MVAWEVILLLAGFACLCVSFFIAAGKSSAAESSKAGQTSSEVWTEKEEQMIRGRVQELLREEQDELVETTTDQLNRLCNEKIMAFDEFSQQLLEKINANHQEVVFMYNMMNEKKKEIAGILSEQVVREEKKEEKESKEEAGKNEEPVEQKKKVQKKEDLFAPADVLPPEQPLSDSRSEDVNGLIQKMYKEGKSIMEISKELNIGQGEVKLIITLYGGRGR